MADGMGFLEIVPANVEKAAEEIRQLAANYKGGYEDVLEQVRTLTKVDFTGPAADEFRTEVNKFEEDFIKMKNLMDRYAAFLDQAAAEHRNAIQRQIEAIPRK